ncbi:exosome complex exonuclease rrp6 [Diplogelasinospora grovesii]|uniref:Exosome complex exonuclease rrp6 n=1 Tax=Diplogelasinospora grovesii TaxID=303347 RepID=A0AAN6N8W2_9PEZI|nr:exosome complex exonuclease rrp6 [Diplogelasinospora grovesii]
MDPSQDFKALRERIQGALVSTTRTVNRLANEDLEFQRTVYPSVSSQLDQKSERLFKLANGLLKSAGNAVGHSVSSVASLEDADDIDNNWRGILDVVDSLLEKTDTCLDEYTGLIKRKNAPTAESAPAPKKAKTSDRLEWSMKRANILKPQNAFDRKPDNFETGPWKPLLSTKPHAKTPLEESMVTFTDENENTQYRHPYENEILNMQYPQAAYEKREPIMYEPVETTSAIWVDTYEGVLEMLDELKKAKEIALDLEHHDFRTYTGLLSLMQISTRDKDWIVDTLVPWRHKLEVLNEVFADPSIVKVLHGAFMDIIWLQRDLGLYVVGLFDTHHASDLLGYAGRSLAFLLKKFADFDADKKYQLADWRIRPLPEEMFYYARSDTHYLLYIYDMIRNELVERSDRSNPENDLIERVIQKSKEVSLQRYENPGYDSETGLGARGWYNTLAKSPTLFNSEQFAVYKAVHSWRNDLARREDESPMFVMSQQVLADVARMLPTDKKALWSLLSGNAKALKVHLDELFELIQEAKAKGQNGPTMMDFFRASYETSSVVPKAADTKAKTAVNTDVDMPDVTELRSTRSQLWGNMPLSSVWDGSSKKAPADSEDKLEIVLPYHQFTQITAEMPAQQPQQAEPEPAEPAADVEMQENQEFTLKAGRKRKSEERDAESEEEESESGSEAECGSESESESEDKESSEEASAPNSGAEDQQKDVQGGTEDFIEMEDDEEPTRAEVRAANQAKHAALTDKPKFKRIDGKMANVERGRHSKVAGKKEHKQAQQQSRVQEKETAKLARRQRKLAQRRQRKAEQKAKQKDEGEQKPFDYSKAASVLHAPKTNSGGGRGGGGGSGGRGGGNGGRGGKGKAPFDPYAKQQGEGPKGVRNRNYERAGRSATFKK